MSFRLERAALAGDDLDEQPGRISLYGDNMVWTIEEKQS